MLLNRSEVMDLINEIEETFPVDTWAVDDIHVWPLIRIPLAMKLYALSSSETNVVSSGKPPCTRAKQIPYYLAGWIRQYLSSFNDSAGNQKQISNTDILFFTHTACRHLLNNAWYDVLCGPLQEELDSQGLGSVILESAPLYEYRIPRSQKSYYIQNAVDVIKIKGRLTSRPDSSHFLNSYSEVYETILRGSGIRIPTIQQISKQTYRLECLASFWEKRLSTVNPQMVFMVTYYGELGMALNLACVRLGIPSVDIQHGVQGDCHVAYGRWANVPRTGYELLPNVFWCWSEDEKDAIEHWNKSCSKRHQAVIGGNPWLSMWLDDNNYIVQQYDQLLYKQMYNIEGQINILYTLQPGYDPPGWFFDAMFSSPRTWKWWVRLHPGMSHEKERIKELFASYDPQKVDIDKASIMPLPALLRHVSVHVTRFSSTVIEAAEFNVSSIILDEDGVLLYSKFIKTGHAKYADDAQGLLDLIKHNVKDEKSVLTKYNIDAGQVIISLLGKYPKRHVVK